MRLDEVYANSGLGKWFKKESATKEPGWDRYNSAGKRAGKCGDAKEGEPYSACLSKQKAQKLGKKGIANFVKRKREAQAEAGRGEKGTGKKGKKPIFVETGAAKKEKVHEQMNPIQEDCGCEHNKDKELVKKIKEKLEKKQLNEDAPMGKPFRTPGGPKKFAVRVQNDKGNVITVRFGDPNMEIKRDDPERRKNFRARHHCENPGPRTKARYWSCRMWEKGKSVSQVTKECADFTELDLSPFKGKKTLIETPEGDWYGTLGVFKDNFALFEGETVIKSIDPLDVTKVVCENTRVVIMEKNKPNDPDKWSSCKSQAKSKFDVYPSAYANAWAAKCYKKKGGTWRSVKEETAPELELLNEVVKKRGDEWVVMNKDETKVLGTHPSKTKALAQLRAIEANKARHGMHENTDMLLKDKLQHLFFESRITEEVVNKDHKGSMTAAELKKRDEIAAKLKKRGNIKRIKTEKRLDSQEEAEFRTATFQVLAMRKGKKGSKRKKSDK